MTQTDTGFCRIVISDVDYLEAQNKHVHVCLSNGTSVQIRELFARCEEVFSPERGFLNATAAISCSLVTWPSLPGLQ